MILIVEGHALPLIQSFCYSHQIDITLNLEVFFFFFPISNLSYLQIELPENSCLEFSYANAKHLH